MWDANPLDSMSQCRQSERNYLFDCVSNAFARVVSSFTRGASQEQIYFSKCRQLSRSESKSPCNKPQSLRVQFRKQVQAILGISEPADDERSIHWEGDVQESSISLNLQNSGSFRLKSFQPCAQILNARNE